MISMITWDITFIPWRRKDKHAGGKWFPKAIHQVGDIAGFW
jgi:hypothetical protein